MNKKKRMFIIGIVVVLVIAVLVVNKQTNFLANVMRNGSNCTDEDGGIKPFQRGVFSVSEHGQSLNEQDVCDPFPATSVTEWYCPTQPSTAAARRDQFHTTVNCVQGCKDGACRNCNNPEGILACTLGLASCDALCMTPPGYGYGYGRGGNGTGYGYGYGYQRIDAKAKVPFLYLTTVIQKLSKTVYDGVVSKLGFQMVKFPSKAYQKINVQKKK